MIKFPFPYPKTRRTFKKEVKKDVSLGARLGRENGCKNGRENGCENLRESGREKNV